MIFCRQTLLYQLGILVQFFIVCKAGRVYFIALRAGAVVFSVSPWLCLYFAFLFVDESHAHRSFEALNRSRNGE